MGILRGLLVLVVVGYTGSDCTRAQADPSSVPVLRSSDVVIVIDQSIGALLASGVDVNANGIVGQNRRWVANFDPFFKPAEAFTTDSGDTVHELQMKVARALVPALAARGNRLGLFVFTRVERLRQPTIVRYWDRTVVKTPIGSSEAVRVALDEVPPAQRTTRTDLARTLALAAELFDAAPAAESPRPRVLLLLSLGRPTAPDGLHFASERALETARGLAGRGISIWAVPFGAADPQYLLELTEITGGRLVALDELLSVFGGRR